MVHLCYDLSDYLYSLVKGSKNIPDKIKSEILNVSSLDDNMFLVESANDIIKNVEHTIFLNDNFSLCGIPKIKKAWYHSSYLVNEKHIVHIDLEFTTISHIMFDFSLNFNWNKNKLDWVLKDFDDENIVKRLSKWL